MHFHPGPLIFIASDAGAASFLCRAVMVNGLVGHRLVGPECARPLMPCTQLEVVASIARGSYAWWSDGEV